MGTTQMEALAQIKQNTEAAGIAKTEERTQVATEEEIVTDISADEEVIEAPAPDPYRWRYILAILIIVLVAGTAGLAPIRLRSCWAYY